jgi:hypothetical protein
MRLNVPIENETVLLATERLQCRLRALKFSDRAAKLIAALFIAVARERMRRARRRESKVTRA